MNSRVSGFVLGLLLFTGPSVASAIEVVGIPRVLDADTLTVNEQRIRVFGIDAPESDQFCIGPLSNVTRCGIESKDALVAFLANRSVRCNGSELDRYNRLIAVCTREGEDVGPWMVRAGYAIAFRRYSLAYISDESAARNQQKGLWLGAFIKPEDWRRRHPGTSILGFGDTEKLRTLLAQGAVMAPSSDCFIKGNVTRDGKLIYHLPGQRDYDRISMRATEKRWFCTEEEATAAGWRRAIR